MKQNKNRKTISYLFSLIVIGLLIVAGPAQGFSFSLNSDRTSATRGEMITFTTEIDIPSGERLPIEELNLKLSGPQEISCKFDTAGNKISGCDGISIERTQNSFYGYGYNYGYFGYGYNFGYGYGYETGKLKYIIKFDTTNYLAGDYSSELSLKINNKTFTEQGENISIIPRSTNSGGGSCRTNWQCTEWSACVNGIQTRTCTKERNQCFAGIIPEQVRFCTETFQLTENLQNTIQENINDEQNEEEIKTEESLSVSRITGAVVGVAEKIVNSTSALIILVIVVFAVAFSSIFIKIKRIRAHRQKIFSENFYKN